MSQPTKDQVSVILPVLNEADYLQDALAPILGQEFNGELEVILAIGPSKDRTMEIAKKISERDPRVIIIENPSGRTAAGLNLALAKSRFPIIVRVDGHSEIPKNYVSTAVEVLKKTGAVNVGGMMAAQGRGLFERAVAAAMRSSLGVGPAKFHTGGNAGEVDTVYLGSFKREALLAIGGFNEKFTRAQDWELNYRLRANGGKIYFDPRMAVTYRPRRSLTALAKQYFEYGRWRRAVSRTHVDTLNLRYLTPPFTLIVSLISIVGSIFNSILIIPFFIYLGFIFIASMLLGRGLEKLILPSVLLTMQMSWAFGFLTSPKSIAK
jgi:glycosyltransferase involved in cell wall biosynthesis